MIYINLTNKYFNQINFKIAFINKINIKNFFNVKDRVSKGLSSAVVYEFQCPGCSQGSYIGGTVRTLEARFCSHMGRSYRTGITLSKKEASSIRSHIVNCKTDITLENFKILEFSTCPNSLRILESLYIKTKNPSLNSDSTSVPLQIL